MFSVVADDQGYWALPGRAVKLHHGRRRDCDARLDLDRRVTRKVKEMLSQLLDRLDWAQARHIGDELSNIDRHSCECPSHRRTQTMMAATAMMIPMDMIGMVRLHRAIFDLNHFL